MLHRYTVRLYDENPLDAELVDILADLDRRQRQELLKLLLRIGHKSLNNGMTVEQAMEQSVLSDMTEKMNNLTSVRRANMGSSYSRKNKQIAQQYKNESTTALSENNPDSNQIESVSLDEILSEETITIENTQRALVKDTTTPTAIDKTNLDIGDKEAVKTRIEEPTVEVENSELVDTDPYITEMPVDEDDDDDDDDDLFDGLGALASKFN